MCQYIKNRSDSLYFKNHLFHRKTEAFCIRLSANVAKEGEFVSTRAKRWPEILGILSNGVIKNY
jgi:hypothetical protein